MYFLGAATFPLFTKEALAPVSVREKFAEKLNSFELRQLKQRVALRCHLQPLDLDETIGYVRRRLQLAGAGRNAETLFPEDTIAKIHRYARGIPRVINTICENGLISSHTRQMPEVPIRIDEEVADELCLEVASSPGLQIGKGSDQVLQAVRTLLQLHERLQGEVPKSVSLAVGAIEREALKPPVVL
jgi:hypothetical protein